MYSAQLTRFLFQYEICCHILCLYSKISPHNNEFSFAENRIRNSFYGENLRSIFWLFNVGNPTTAFLAPVSYWETLISFSFSWCLYGIFSWVIDKKKYENIHWILSYLRGILLVHDLFRKKTGGNWVNFDDLTSIILSSVQMYRPRFSIWQISIMPKSYWKIRP